jgi:hypothetical protein
MKKITILLPVHKLDEDDIIMLKNAVDSVEDFHNDVKLSIVSPKKLKAQLVDLGLSDKLEINFIENTTNQTDFTSQVNLGIEKCDTEWFSILEMDDEYTKVWLTAVSEYAHNYKDVDVFLPIVKDVNVEGSFLSFTNESVWAYGFTETQGYLDNEVLLEYQNYQTSGGLYRTEVIKENGSFKDNLKLTFSYELLLRLTHNGVKVMGIPKIGYQHVNFRENSLFWSYKNDDKIKLNEDEVKFWLDTAKKEFFFKNKREITYTQA